MIRQFIQYHLNYIIKQRELQEQVEHQVKPALQELVVQMVVQGQVVVVEQQGNQALQAQVVHQEQVD
jgi:hypothetical protein